MKRLYLIFFLTVLGSYLSRAQSDSLLHTLKKVIELKETFVQAKLDRIANLKNQLAATSPSALDQSFDLTNRLYHEYKVFIYDSAINYATRLTMLASRMKDLRKVEYAKVKTAFILISAGMYKETFDSLYQVKVQRLDDSSRFEYYSLIARANYDLGSFDNDQYFNQKYHTSANLYLDSSLQLCQPGSFRYLDISNYKNLMNNRAEEGLAELNLLFKMKITDHQRAVYYHHLGLYSLQKKELAKAIDAFMMSSIYDIKTATKETAAMTDLADLLYQKGDIEDAYLFIHQSMEDALFYGARQRKVHIGSLLPIIAGERLSKLESQRQAWLVYSISLTLVAIIILVFVVITAKQYKKLKEADRKIVEANESLQNINHKLREADRIKEEYIGYYFNINSDLLDKIEILKKSIDQKLLARKFEDLRFVADGLDLRRERENLYRGFDTTFLKIFPDFIIAFNSFFTDENRMQLKDNQLLNTELRIFALMRLGIHDTEKIAKILGYSVNTIYSYKTKVKSKSILPNDEFESRVMEIQTV